MCINLVISLHEQRLRHSSVVLPITMVSNFQRIYVQTGCVKSRVLSETCQLGRGLCVVLQQLSPYLVHLFAAPTLLNVVLNGAVATFTPNK